MGDLNYRLTKEIEDDEVMSYIEKGLNVELSDYDQLQRERDAGRVFEDFNEGLRFFQPSYKYIPGTTTYDYYNNEKNDKNLLGSKKKRVPAWCDRILWRTNNMLPCQNGEGYVDPDHSRRIKPALSAPKRKMMDRRHYYSDYASNGLPCSGDEGISLVAYNTCRNVVPSDHVPVYALLNVRVKKIDWAMREVFIAESSPRNN